MSRTTNALFNQRFLLGIYAPFILELIVYAIYLFAKGAEFNFGVVLWSVILFAPALFIYMISPMIIYFISGLGNYYKKNLQDNIDSLFIFSDDEKISDEKQKNKIREEIDNKLIPELVSNVRGLYIDSYISRSRDNKKDNLLSNFETIFLFSTIWASLSFANFIGIIVLHFTPISLDFIILEQIDNWVNIVIFALLFAALAIVSELLAYYSLGRLRKLMLETLPIVTFVDEEEQIKQNNYIRAVSQFPLDSVVNESVLRKHKRPIDQILEKELSSPLSDAIRIYARNQVAKQQAWRIYKPILDDLDIPAEQTAVIRDRFFDSPFYDIARDVFSYDHEVNSLKTDIEYVKNRLKLWEEISEEEKATSLLFLFRSSEQLFKSILDRFGARIDVYTNFTMILKFLREKEIITEKEEDSFNTIRKKRNTLVHQSGRIVTISKKEVESFLKNLEKVLLRVEKQFKKESKEK
ncbi:MAG: hypothetical protein ACTSXA_04665 [Candidatus Heimdallarchaeota archaeon]